MEFKPYWKNGANFPVSAEVANDTIEQLKATLGKDNITANELLEASRDEAAPLHSCFEWDDTVAAEQYRRIQAAQMIRSLAVTIIYPERKPVTCRAQVNVTSPTKLHEEGKFVSVQRAMEVPEYKTIILKRALAELRAFQCKYAIYEELSGVFKAIDEYEHALQ